MATPFDPYREWLEIDGGPAATDFYRVFGLPAFTADPQVIAAAANLTIHRVQQLPPGRHAAVQRRLVQELSQARRCLLDPAARARYDEALRGKRASTSRPIAEAIPVAPVEQSVPDELWDDVTRIPRRLHSAPRPKRSSGILVAAGIVVGVGSVLAGLAYWQMQPGQTASVAVAAAPENTPVAVPRTERPPARPEPVKEPDAPSLPVPNPGVSSTPPEPPSPLPPANPIEPAPKPVVVAEPTIPKPADEAAKVVASPQRRAAFDRAVNHAGRALVARDLDEAARQLDVAEKNIPDPDGRDEVRRLRTLARQLGLFLGAVRAGLARFEAAETIDIDGIAAAIVDVKPDGVALFIEGSRRDFTIATMPASMALFFARAAADESAPVAAVFHGAFHVVDPQGDREKARQLWRFAAASDLPLDDLLPLADGPPLASRRESIPDANRVEAARIVLQGRFADLVVTSKTAARKSLVSEKMLEAARRSDDSAEQYAALAQARDWAVSAGDPARALVALDEMANWFDVDSLALKSAALGTSIAGSVTAGSAADAAAAAIDLSSSAQRAGRQELALSLADTAYAAARKSRDGALIKRAYQRRSELSGDGQKSKQSKAAATN